MVLREFLKSVALTDKFLMQKRALACGYDSKLSVCVKKDSRKTCTRFFLYKKPGSGHSTKSFLISFEILSILVLNVSLLVSYFLNAGLSMWSLSLR